MLSPEARKLLEQVRKKLRPDFIEISEANSSLILIDNDDNEVSSQIPEQNDDQSSSPEILTPVSIPYISQETDFDSSSSLIARLEPTIEIIEGDSPLKQPFTSRVASKLKSPPIKRPIGRASGLRKKPVTAKSSNSKSDSQRKLSSFGFSYKQL